MTDIPSIPASTKQWAVVGYDGFDSLRLSEEPIPELGDSQVLVKSMYTSCLVHNSRLLGRSIV